MGNLVVEICLISARGLRNMASSSLLRRHWFAVAWIDPNNKYCSKVTASMNSLNPMWNTKFTAVIDEAGAEKDLVLHVEVYSREPLFLRERLEGETNVGLREFLDKYVKNSERGCPGAEELGSFQLRKRKSDKARGFVDMSIRISREINALNSPLGEGEGFQLRGQGENITLAGDGQRDLPGSSHWAPSHGTESRAEGHLPYHISHQFNQNYTKGY
ncbi:hypothetical protein QQ045_031685 [Rhodiola kirilowii]